MGRTGELMENRSFEYAFFFCAEVVRPLNRPRGQHLQAIADSVSNPKLVFFFYCIIDIAWACVCGNASVNAND